MTLISSAALRNHPDVQEVEGDNVTQFNCSDILSACLGSTASVKIKKHVALPIHVRHEGEAHRLDMRKAAVIDSRRPFVVMGKPEAEALDYAVGQLPMMPTDDGAADEAQCIAEAPTTATSHQRRSAQRVMPARVPAPTSH